MNFKSFSGRVTSIGDFFINSKDNEGCYQTMGVENLENGSVNFVIEPLTYFVGNEIVGMGDTITGYYNGDAPVPMIYPPQYRALIIAKDSPSYNVKVAFFDNNLVSSDGQLKLNISEDTQMMLRNGQPFLNNPENHMLVVSYGISTKSIPAQTTPSQIIVWCSM